MSLELLVPEVARLASVVPLFGLLGYLTFRFLRRRRTRRMWTALFTDADREREQRIRLLVGTRRASRWKALWRPMAGRGPRFSLSFALIGLAVRRLPAEMTEAERARWEREMKADAASLPRWRLRRIRFAFNLWRKGAPRMPAGSETAARAARDL